jgi:hypothetical protein
MIARFDMHLSQYGAKLSIDWWHRLTLLASIPV